MKRNIICTLFILFAQYTLFAQTQTEIIAGSQILIDTIYYNYDWKVVSSKITADYYRVKVNSDRDIDKRFNDYFITGELQSKGGYISMDNIDDSNTVFDGKCVIYHKNGNIASERVYLNGELNGKFTAYNEDGSIKSQANFANGKIDGVYTKYTEDGLRIQIQYNNGVAEEFYTVLNNNNCIMKFNTSTNEPIWESPLINEREKIHIDGEAVQYYNKNGIRVCASNSSVKDYGKYYHIYIVIENNSLASIEFDPTTSINATSINKYQEIQEIRVLSSYDYMKKIKRSQNWQTALLAISEISAASQAGYSTSTTQSNTYSNGSMYAYGSNGNAYGSYSGSSKTTLSTKQYDGNAAYQAKVIANNRI